MSLSSSVPLIIDLDGTLLHSDLLIESALGFVRDHPLQSWRLLPWLLQGKAVLKQQLASAVHIDAATLPYNHDVLDLIRQQRAQGRRIVLATASHRLLAQKVAEHLQLFDEVLATADNHNLSAGNKAAALVQGFGERGFDYAGNSRDDIAVWQHARKAIVVNGSAALSAQAGKHCELAQVLPAQSSWRHWLRSLRLHQWVKNLLIFVPLLTAHRFSESHLALLGLLAFLCFSVCASSLYLLNDMLDLRDDRQHPHKRTRPLPAGRIPLQTALLLAPLLLVASIALGWLLLPPLFTPVLLGYAALTLLYSVWLKQWMIIDVLTLALLYIVRLLAGAVAFAVPLSFWLLAFALFLFVSLALVKRYAELTAKAAAGFAAETRVRGYQLSDSSLLGMLGTSSGYIAVLVLALYINDPNTLKLYRQPEFIWFACPLLLGWISRVWLLAHRGQMNEDPVLFAVQDRSSLCLGALFLLVFALAI